MVNYTTLQQELTEAGLRKVKVEDGKIDVYALLRLATQSASKAPQKKLLSEAFHKTPLLDQYLSHCTFGRKTLSPALTAAGSFYLMLTIADADLGRNAVLNSCCAIGQHLGMGLDDAARLFARAEDDMESKPECDHDSDSTIASDVDGDASKGNIEARIQARIQTRIQTRIHAATFETANMNKLQAAAHASLIAVQLQKELTGGIVPPELQEASQDAVHQIGEILATNASKGTHDAFDILKTMNHSDYEASNMASSFGKFLVAARTRADYNHYIPNTRKVQFGVSALLPSSYNNVALYHPKLHADIIIPAYESFKQSAVYARYLDPSKEHERKIQRRHMEIMDIGETHSRYSRHGLVQGAIQS